MADGAAAEIGGIVGTFTFVPLWVFQDLAVYAVGFATLVFALRKEAHPETVVAELAAFCFLNAAVYENFATLMGLYGYGRSLLMVFNVPFSVPLVEWLVIYSTLRLLARRDMPAWAKPFVVGLSGMVFDFSLDPVAIRQVFDTAEGRIGRWTWYPGPADVQIGGEPVYNFTGWILLCGYFAATVLAGRAWHRRSGFSRKVGLAYPFLAALAALGVLVSPLSKFLLWLDPFMRKGSAAEWIMLGALGGISLAILVVFGRKPIDGAEPGRGEWPALLTLVGIPLLNLALCLACGYGDALPVVAVAALAQAGGALLLLSGRSPRGAGQGPEEERRGRAAEGGVAQRVQDGESGPPGPRGRV